MYNSPFNERYGTDTMRNIFSDKHKYTLWRKLWVTLAQAQRRIGVNITEEQINEMLAAVDNIDFDAAKKYERTTHHDVMAHIMEFSDKCPTAKNIIHLGATSCYVTDNADIIMMYEALQVIQRKLCYLILIMDVLADIGNDMVIAGRTHLQLAQLTTVGKRICMWLQDLDIAYDMITNAKDTIKLLGYKGATGSQASCKTLHNDYGAAQFIDQCISSEFDIKCVSISGQTYTRLYDSIVANALSLLAQAITKMATDIRLMSCFGEMYEQFTDGQVGSSAMPYKRNPITCEKICGISRYIIVNAQNTAITASTQWLERTLDDSSNRRIVLPELFMATDEVMESAIKVITHINTNADRCLQIASDHAKMASLEDDVINHTLHGGNRQEEHQYMINSSGSENTHINIGFAKEQTDNFVKYIDRKYRVLPH